LPGIAASIHKTRGDDEGTGNRAAEIGHVSVVLFPVRGSGVKAIKVKSREKPGLFRGQLFNWAMPIVGENSGTWFFLVHRLGPMFRGAKVPPKVAFLVVVESSQGVHKVAGLVAMEASSKIKGLMQRQGIPVAQFRDVTDYFAAEIRRVYNAWRERIDMKEWQVAEDHAAEWSGQVVQKGSRLVQ
jgi:hypothetical protein